MQSQTLSGISPVSSEHTPVWPGDAGFEAVTTRDSGAACPARAILPAAP